MLVPFVEPVHKGLCHMNPPPHQAHNITFHWWRPAFGWGCDSWFFGNYFHLCLILCNGIKPAVGMTMGHQKKCGLCIADFYHIQTNYMAFTVSVCSPYQVPSIGWALWCSVPRVSLEVHTVRCGSSTSSPHFITISQRVDLSIVDLWGESLHYGSGWMKTLWCILPQYHGQMRCQHADSIQQHWAHIWSRTAATLKHQIHSKACQTSCL